MSNLPDQLQPRALCTLLDVCKRIPGYEPGQDGEIDDILDDLIVQESRDYMEDTGREITAMNNDTSRSFDIDETVVNNRRIWIGDAATVTGVQIKQHDGSTIQTLDATAWVAMPRLREDWQPITRLAFPLWTSSPATLWYDTVCVVTGTWGFPAIPDTVRRDVATFVLNRYINDVAAAGTALAQLLNQPEFNLAGALRVAIQGRERLRLYP